MVRRTTIDDVAKLAGVGKVTVSYVLNGRSRTARISDDTAERVRRAAAELNFRPNAVARMLATQRTNLLAVVFQRGYFFSSWSSFTAEVMRGVSSGAVDLGYDLMLHTREVEQENEADVLADGRVDGALVLRDEGDPTVESLAGRKFPCVRFFSRSHSEDDAFVDADNFSGGRMATRHLIELGHRRIAMIRGPHRSTSANDRYNGYRDALEQAGIGVAPERNLAILSSSSDMEPLRRLLASPDRPTALFVWSDEVALGCMMVVRELGLRIPEDISIVGFDSLEACQRAVPPLTSVKQPIFDMAKEATALLVSILREQEVAKKQVLFPLSLDLRGSTAPCPSPSTTWCIQ
jgi:LacI family transcriptional regulator